MAHSQKSLANNMSEWMYFLEFQKVLVPSQREWINSLCAGAAIKAIGGGIEDSLSLPLAVKGALELTKKEEEDLKLLTEKATKKLDEDISQLRKEALQRLVKSLPKKSQKVFNEIISKNPVYSNFFGD
ncbi:MAG: hypothetical protein AAGA30_00345 [Planctomycetota bacterium]